MAPGEPGPVRRPVCFVFPQPSACRPPPGLDLDRLALPFRRLGRSTAGDARCQRSGEDLGKVRGQTKQPGVRGVVVVWSQWPTREIKPPTLAARRQGAYPQSETHGGRPANDGWRRDA